MAGKAVSGPQGPHRFSQTLGQATQADAQSLLAIMQIVHQEPLATAFADLQVGKVRTADALKLAHLFEEIGALTIHQLVNRDLLFDAYAFDSYWASLKSTVTRSRKATKNPKFGENFELLAEMAADYRQQRPPKSAAAA
ncbi:MAG: hypothetical protein WAT58_02765 [Candidatus Dormiibacterota bacterium]